MSNEFTDLIARVRAGDARAAEELFRRYEPAVRMEVRLKMRDPRLRRVFESMDVCQSVFGSFFLRATLGQYDLDDPDELVKLFVGMARNKVAAQARRERQQCRDNRRIQSLGEKQLDITASDPSPSQIVAGKELLEAARQALTEKERQVADRRARGLSWAKIAAELGDSAEALRKQHERAVKRVAIRFGLDEEDDE